MKTMTGIVLMGLALVFAGCNSEKGHNQANENAVRGHGAPERTSTGVNNPKPAVVVNQAAQQAQGAIATVQYTADAATADAHAVVAETARSVSGVVNGAQQTAVDANNVKNDAAAAAQSVINNANRDVKGLENAFR
jgi:hypothetical protein